MEGRKYKILTLKVSFNKPLRIGLDHQIVVKDGGGPRLELIDTYFKVGLVFA